METGRAWIHPKYQLIELLPGDGVEDAAPVSQYRRDVTVHLLVGGKNFNEAFLVRLPCPTSMAKLIEVGEHEAILVVTVAPPYMRLEEWLAEQDKASAAAKIRQAG
jgi:hypothetical protein